MKSRKTLMLLLLISFTVFAFIFNGCSGGDDNGTAGPTATPSPAITDISETKMQVGDQVTVFGQNFGSSQGSGNVTINGVEVKKGKEVEVQISVRQVSSWNDTEIVFTVPPKVPEGAVTIVVTTDAGDTAEFGALTGQFLEFIPQKWQGMFALSNAFGVDSLYEDDEIRSVDVVVLSDDRVIAIYSSFHDNDQNESRLFARIWDGTEWGEETPISPVFTGEDPEAMRIAADNNGNAMVVFSQDNTVNQHIYWTFYDGSSWSTAAILDAGLFADTDPDSDGGPHFAFADDGTGVVVWKDGNGNMSAAVYDGGTFLTPTQIDNDPTVADTLIPRLAFIEGTNRAYAVWSEWVPADGEYGLFARRYDAGTGFAGSVTRIDFTTGNTENVYTKDVGFSESRGIIAFEKPDDVAGGDHVYIATYDAASDSFTLPTGPADRVDTEAYEPDINDQEDQAIINVVFLSNGEGMVTFPEDYEGDGWIVSTIWRTDGTWTPLMELQGNWTDDLVSLGNLAVDTYGRAFYLHQYDVSDSTGDIPVDSENDMHFVSIYCADDGLWQRPSKTSESLNLPLYGDEDAESIGKVVIDSKGVGYAVFLYATGEGEYRIQYNIYK